jgi:NAD(P)H-hydrate repair Nnr-like enzyme with NAD(P)H-hydrate epimerase domain
MNSPSSPHFKTKQGLQITGLSAPQYAEMWQSLLDHYGLHPTQLVEASSYSMAMVVRYALGLTADEGKVITLAANRPAGWVALATMRHLVTAGADGIVVLDTSDPSEGELARQLFTLERLGIPVVALDDLLADDPNRFFESCHNVICGWYNRESQPTASVSRLVDMLNEASTPVHTIEAPLGMDPTTGAMGSVPLYASSTLSLGAPFSGLHAANDLVGRHYLCDISCPRELYEKYGLDITKAFAEQPVVQISPL